MRVVSRWCRCIVQRLCATDCKRPCLVRAAAPHSAPARTPGVYAQRLCTMQSQQSIHNPSPRGRGLGLGIENSHYLIKKQIFSTSCMCHSIPLRHIFYMYFTQKNEKLLLIEKKCTIILTIAQKAHKKQRNIKEVFL